VLVVPEGGRGRVRQWTLSERTLRGTGAGILTLTAVLVAAAAVQLATLGRVMDHDRIVGENLQLRARMREVDQQLAALEPLVQRVRVYDEQLRVLTQRGAIPGFGGLDEEEMAARQAWLEAVVPVADQDPQTIEERADGLEDELDALDIDRLGENLAWWLDVAEALPQLWPVDGVVTSGFGYRESPFNHRTMKFHGGLDIGAPYGSDILATADGTVVFAGWDSGHGRTVIVDHGHGVQTRYCHASQLVVEVGQDVLAGQTVGLVGSSGMSTGPHLHYEIFLDGERVDPRPYLP
jgi:murein DD-endopeptidase MepM/ murein hydrolase activator NlpD